MRSEVTKLRREVLSRSSLQESRDDEEEETDVEEHFCVNLPCYTFDEFQQLEDELRSNGPKRKALVRYDKYVMH